MGRKNGNVTSLTDKWATWIIGICIVLLLFGVGCFVVSKTILSPKVVQLEIKIIPDSVSAEATYSKREVDSLIIVTKTKMESYDHYFQTETAQKKQEEDYKSLGALLLSVIVGLGGFFGFKSFKDIKDKGEQTAKEVASEKAGELAEKVAEEAAEKYLSSKLPEVVQKQFEESFKDTTINSIKESVKTEVVPQILQTLQDQHENEGEEEQLGEHPTDEQGDGMMTPEDMFNRPNNA